MVIVSLAFIGIIVGALLSAAGYAYKLKQQDLNARDNFYYVEQAMQEIYSGVGTHTVEQLKDAYNYTIENMVRYDLALNTYTTISDEEANEMFKQKFMDNIKDSDYFKSGNAILADSLANYISNETVVMDKEKLILDVTDEKITIKNVTLTRTQEYGTAEVGTYTQTLSTDIVISEPDFEVNFNNLTSDYSTIFDFALIADMGIEISQEGNPVTIVGNVYAASDYYNKEYNQVAEDEDMTFSKTYAVGGTTDTVTYEFEHGSVTSKYYNTAIDNTLENLYAKDKEGKSAKFDGENLNSMYSGLYIDDTQVSIMASTIIIPGTLSIMDSSEVSIYGKNSSVTESSEIWVDNVVLDGYSRIDDKGNYEGPEAIIRANLFVKDDTEINAAGASFTLKGGYYGYGDSTEKDGRVFVPTVKTENFTVPVYDKAGNIVTTDDGETVTENRGHYNSSAIIINGQQATLDLQETTELYLAGRAYIEMSKKNTAEEDTVEVTDADGNEKEVDVVTQTYSYMPTETITAGDTVVTSYIRDYKTGESISVKSSQLAYIPVSKAGVPSIVEVNGYKFVGVELAEEFAGVGFFDDFFPASIFDSYVPVITQKVSGKTYYYYDFSTAFDIITEVAATSGGDASAMLDASDVTQKYGNADDYATGFIVAYYEAASDEEDETFTTIVDYLNDYDDYKAAEVQAPKTAATVYSSGAITTMKNKEFTMVTKNDTDVIANLLGNRDYSDNVAVEAATNLDIAYDALQLSNDLEMEYNFMKWNLDHYEDTLNLEKQYVKDLVAEAGFGETIITPINKYLIMSNITSNITPDNLELASGYKLWINDGEETLTITGSSNIRGMIITKGDVVFGDDVTSFEGLIVAGGKIYVKNKVTNITASPEICRSILRECVTSSDTLCADVLKVFTEYKDFDPDADDTTTAIEVNQINYTDVVSLENWMKNVE